MVSSSKKQCYIVSFEDRQKKDPFVLEIERILAYMHYVVDEIDPEIPGYEFYKQRATNCIAGITQEVNTIAKEISAITSMAVTPEGMQAYTIMLRRRLFTILIQLEGFEVVTSAAELANPYEEDIFGPLKRFIYPEWLLEKPPVQDPDRNPLEDIMKALEEDLNPDQD